MINSIGSINTKAITAGVAALLYCAYAIADPVTVRVVSCNCNRANIASNSFSTVANYVGSHYVPNGVVLVTGT